jgi:hypothetical protein
MSEVRSSWIISAMMFSLLRYMALGSPVVPLV